MGRLPVGPCGMQLFILQVKDGDHRLSRPQDVSAILASLQELIDVVTACPESGHVDCSYLSQEPMPFFQVH